MLVTCKIACAGACFSSVVDVQAATDLFLAQTAADPQTAQRIDCCTQRCLCSLHTCCCSEILAALLLTLLYCLHSPALHSLENCLREYTAVGAQTQCTLPASYRCRCISLAERLLSGLRHQYGLAIGGAACDVPPRAYQWPGGLWNVAYSSGTIDFCSIQ